MSEAGASPDPPRAGPLPRRELEAIRSRIARGLVAAGYTRGQVGQVLNLSPATVRRRLAGSRPYV